MPSRDHSLPEPGHVAAIFPDAERAPGPAGRDAPITPAQAGSSVPTPLSFTRAAVTRLRKLPTRLETLRLDLDAGGIGEALYRFTLDGWVFHFFVLSVDLPEDQKLDRNFAAGWDVMGAFCEGDWTRERESRLREQIPLQRGGRPDYDTLIYGRGNRSSRLFSAVVDALAAGRQPDPATLAGVGYILRTTAFIGNGHIGTKPLAAFAEGHPLAAPYHAQMCTGLLLREFVFDLVDAMAVRRSASACRLARPLRRFLGLGNSAATGLVPFLTSHPKLVGAWEASDRAALAEILSATPTQERLRSFLRLVDRAATGLEQASRPDDGVFRPDAAIAAELREVAGRIDIVPARWGDLHRLSAAGISDETLATIEGLLLEVEPAIVERHQRLQPIDETLDITPGSTTDDLMAEVKARYGWALEAAARPGSGTYFWYRATGAPRDLRRGLRGRMPEAEHETAMDLVPKIAELAGALEKAPGMPLSDMLAGRPDLRAVAARVQSLRAFPAGEMAVDFTAADFSPFPPVRRMLSLFGLDKIVAAQPKSVRGTFLQGAPLVEDLEDGSGGAAKWPYCLIPTAEEIAAAPALPPIRFPSYEAPAGTADALAPDEVRAAPIEIARAFEWLMQATGTALGVATPAAGLATSVVAAAPGRLPALLAEIAADDGPLSFSVEGAPDMPAVALDAGGAHPLKALVPALDLARDRAARLGHGVVAIRGSAKSHLLRDILDQAARTDGPTIWCWSPGDASPLAEIARAAGWPDDALPENATAAVFAWRDPDDLAPTFRDGLRARCAGADISAATGLASGIVCEGHAFEDLLNAAARFCVKPETECRLRDETIDPLTMF